MAYGKRLLFEDQRSQTAANIVASGANYLAVGAAMSHPIRMILLSNLTDDSLQFSIDGVNDHFVVASNSGMVLDVSANKINEEGFFLGVGESIHVKQINGPTTGNVYVSVIYGKGD